MPLYDTSWRRIVSAVISAATANRQSDTTSNSFWANYHAQAYAELVYCITA